jgi:hypothetical protein
MAQGSVRVEGLREWNRYLGLIDKKLQREFQKRLRTEVAEPVARDIRSRASRWADTAPTIKAGTRLGGAEVVQRHPRVTGKRGDFGALQMSDAFLPGLAANEGQIKRGMEGIVDHVIDTARTL